MMTTTHDDQDDDHRQKMCQPEQKTRTKPEIGNETRQETPAAHSTAVSWCYNAKKKRSLWPCLPEYLKGYWQVFFLPYTNIYKYIQILEYWRETAMGCMMLRKIMLVPPVHKKLLVSLRFLLILQMFTWQHLRGRGTLTCPTGAPWRNQNIMKLSQCFVGPE